MKVINRKRRKANKRHRCNYCNSDILPGEKYDDSTNLFDGRIYNWRSCDHCKEIVNKMWEDHESYFKHIGNGATDQDFRDYILEEGIDFKVRRVD